MEAKEMKKTSGRTKDRAILFLINNKSFIILIILMIGAQISSQGLFFEPSNLFSVIRQTTVMCLMGLGFAVVLGAGNLDLSIGHMLGFLSVIYALSSLRFPMVIAIMITLLAGCLSGLGNGLLSIKLGLSPFILTLATGQMFRGMAYLISNGESIGNLDSYVQKIGQGVIFGQIPITVIYIILFAVIMSVLMYRTRFGRHVIATGSNDNAAKVSGVNIDWIKIATFIIMGLMNAVAAIVVTGRISIAMPNVGDGMEMDAIAAVIIGGTALNGGKVKIVGTVAGCFILGIISNLLNLAGVSSFWQWFTKGVIIIFATFIDARTDDFFKNRRSRI